MLEVLGSCERRPLAAIRLCLRASPALDCMLMVVAINIVDGKQIHPTHKWCGVSLFPMPFIALKAVASIALSDPWSNFWLGDIVDSQDVLANKDHTRTRPAAALIVADDARRDIQLPRQHYLPDTEPFPVFFHRLAHVVSHNNPADIG